MSTGAVGAFPSLPVAAEIEVLAFDQMNAFYPSDPAPLPDPDLDQSPSGR
jgi:hypothetical protein